MKFVSTHAAGTSSGHADHVGHARAGTSSGHADHVGHEAVTFREALFKGIAADGGLYRPREMPDLHSTIRGFTRNTSFARVAAELTRALFPSEIGADAFDLAKQSFPFAPRLVPWSDKISILELFHGSSHAFKDFGASFLAACMEYFLAGKSGSAGGLPAGKSGAAGGLPAGKSGAAIILTATSGDTGSAVAQAFHQREHIDVVILYPSGRVSPSQEKHMTTIGGNIHALEVEGNFDDCQRMVKEAFAAPALKHLPLTSANSINVGRLIPQSFYYVYAFAQIQKELNGTPLYFAVPSGNFGNLTAGIYAWKWGLPVRGFIAATNKNDVVPQYLETGLFSPRRSLRTYANAMDVGNPSNFERLLDVFHYKQADIQKMIRAYAVNDDEILRVMKEAWETRGMFVCPHTATGIKSAERFSFNTKDCHIITLATAHPAKFNEVVLKACGKTAPVPEGIAESLKKKKQSVRIAHTLNALSDFLQNFERD
ncbi:MAG: threonine synthase [Salinispira sp.]